MLLALMAAGAVAACASPPTGGPPAPSPGVPGAEAPAPTPKPAKDAPAETAPAEATPSDPASGLPSPAYLPTLARRLLATRMARHGHALADLHRAVLRVDLPAVARAAQHIADEPRIARPGTGMHDELNTQLPAGFFDLQDRLHDRAEALAKAARAGKARAVSDRYGELTATCMACHQVYFDPEAFE